ncbi:Uncharacterised protein [Vibrio cholerae]|nr:Uncharacterised protein [Vibrio cholerae]
MGSFCSALGLLSFIRSGFTLWCTACALKGRFTHRWQSLQ